MYVHKYRQLAENSTDRKRGLLLDREEDFVGLKEVENEGGIIARKCGRSGNLQTCLFQGFPQLILLLGSDCENTKDRVASAKLFQTLSENLPGVEYVDDEYLKLCFASIHLML
jgi:hypothetical protein